MPTTKVGLVIASPTPSSRSAPRTNVVLPAPRSPDTSTTSPGRSCAARSAPARSVPSGLSLAALTQPHPQGDAAREQDGAEQEHRAGVEPGAGQLWLAGGGGGRHGGAGRRGPGRDRAGLGCGGAGLGRSRAGLGRGGAGLGSGSGRRRRRGVLLLPAALALALARERVL